MMFLSAVTAAAMLQAPSATPAPPLEKEASRGGQSVTVKSSNQTSGVTAGYINSLTQVLPTLVRGPQLETLKSIFVSGAMIRKRNNKLDITDTEIARYDVDAQRWTNSTYQFLKDNVSEYAAERFAFRPISPSYVYALPGSHQEGAAQRWGQINEGLSSLLVNFDQLMRDPSIYSEGK